MKHLLIYEKFDSLLISKTINYLASKIGKSESTSFIEVLKDTLKNYDFPISKLEDSDFLYLNKNKALNLIKKENNLDIDYLKFWFSIDNGYLFTSGTGRNVLTLSTNEPIKNIIKDSYILSQVIRDIPTGIIKPVLNYNELRHLDKVIAIYDSSDNYPFGIGTIFIQDNSMYIIQNTNDGGTPQGVEWRRYGRNSWAIANRRSGLFEPASDHRYLHFYEETDKPLEIITKENKDENLDIDPYSYNLKYANNRLITNYSIEGMVKKADFALVLSIEKLIEKGLSINSIQKSRIESKKDALKLTDDDLIRKINLDRYTKAIFNKFGISTNDIELDNLEKIIVKLLMRDLAFYKLISDDSKLGHISDISDRIYDILKAKESKSDVKYLVEYIYNIYNVINSDYNTYYKNYSKNINLIKEYANDNHHTNLTKIMEIFDEISVKIYESINNDKINNLYDLNSYYYKLSSLNSMFKSYIKSQDFKYIFRSLKSENDVKYLLDSFKSNSLESLIEPIMAIKKYVDKNF